MGTIDLADPSSEGFRVAAALREAGFEVRVREVAELRGGTDGGLVILAGDADGAMETLAALRRAEGTKTAPILLVGAPGEGPSDTDALTARGADAFYARPVEVERLVRKVETFFAPPDGRLRSPETDLALRETDPERRGSEPGEGAPGDYGDEEDGRPEPTVQLGESSDAWMAADDPEEEPVSPAPDPVRPERAAPSPSSRPPSGAPEAPDGAQPAEGAQAAEEAEQAASGPELSKRLTRLFVDADRRLFPDEPPLQVRLPGGDESPEELVPDELLASISLPVESVAEDPLDAFTFVGSLSDVEAEAAEGSLPPPAMTPASQPGEGSEEAELRGEQPADDMPGGDESSSISVVRSAGSSVVTSAGGHGDGDRRAESQAGGVTVDALDVGEPTPDGRGRQGRLDRGEALQLLWRLYDHRVEARLSLSDGGDVGTQDVELVLREGEVTALRGPVATRVLEELRREGRIAEAATDEEGAWSLLERAMRAGVLARLDVDRRLRATREELVYDLVDAPALAFEVYPTEPTPSAPPEPGMLLSGALPAVLVEGSRRRLDEARVAELLGPFERLELRLGPQLHARARQARIPPELVSLLERHEGDTLAAMSAEVSAEEGIAGLVLALSEVGALRLIEGSESRGERPVEAVRRAVQAAAARADEADYFALLGVRSDAPARELRAAWVSRRRELVGLPLAACGLEALEPERDRALDALDEAWEILRDERLRKAYRAALAAVGQRC